MAGLRCASRILHFVALAFGVNGLLIRRSQAPCSNSDGLAGYNFSHKGLWIPGYQLIGTGFTKQSCSAECSKLADCVAFSGSFKDDGGNGACYKYTATSGSVPSANDRAYKKCVTGAVTPAAADLTAMHLFPRANTRGRARARRRARWRARARARAQAKALSANPYEALAAQAEGMEVKLAAIAKTMADADVRMRKLKSLVAGTSAMITDASRIASNASAIALKNRGGLLAIGRAKDNINNTFTAISRSSTQIQSKLASVKSRGGAAKGDGAESLTALEPNMTAVEKELKEMNDPNTAKQLADVGLLYKKLTGDISDQVKTVVQANLREVVETQREAYFNYTTALQDNKKDPCCPC